MSTVTSQHGSEDLELSRWTTTERDIQSTERLELDTRDTQDQGFSLPPADTGKEALLFLAGAFATEALTWGFPLCFGVFQSYYYTHDTFNGDSRIATIGTTATGLMYLTFPVWLALVSKFPQWRRYGQLLSLVLMFSGLLGSSFAKTVPQLIATQGVIYGMGGCLIYTYLVLYLDEWFVKRKGLAFGVTWAGTGFAGTVFPPLLQALLDRFGYQTTLRIWAVATLLLLLPTLLTIKPRLPPSRSPKIDLKFLLSPAFGILQLGNIIQGLGFFLPSIYLPTYAHQLGASDFTATATLLAFNMGSIAGCISIGALVDRVHCTTCIALCAVGSAVAVFLFWGLSTRLPLLFLFSVTYGIFAGSSSSAWPGIMKLIGQRTARANPTMIISFLAAGRGIGNIISGPVSEKLVSVGTVRKGQFGYKTGYGPLIVFTGVTAVCSGLTVLARAKPGLL